jgi:hypothetical protein
MAIDLTALANNIETVPFKYGGFDSSVDYRPSVLTADNLAKFGDVETVDDMDSYLEFMVQMLVDWEVSKEGDRLPISVENLKSVPLPMIGKIMEAIVKASGAVDPE